MLRPYRDVLSRPGAWSFSLAAFLLRLPLTAGIGIVLMVSGLYGSYGLAGAVSAAFLVAQAVCAPLIAGLVDRHGQTRVMRPALAVCVTGLAGLVAAAATHAHPATLVAAAVLSGGTLGSYSSLARARWSHLLRDDDAGLHAAYSWESVLDETMFVFGPVVATLLATSVHPTAGLAAPLVALVVGGPWFLAQKVTEPPITPVRTAQTAPRSAVRARGMPVLVVVFVAAGAVFGALDVATVAFANEIGRTELAGVIIGVLSVGSALAGLLYGARHWVLPLSTRFVIGVAIFATSMGLYLVTTTLGPLLVVMFVAGLAVAPTVINGNGLVQLLVPQSRLTEGLTWIGTALGVGMSLGASLGGIRIDATGSRGGFLVAVLSSTVALVVTLAALPRLRATPPYAVLETRDVADGRVARHRSDTPGHHPRFRDRPPRHARRRRRRPGHARG